MSKRNEQVCAVNYLPVQSPVTHETGAWERGMNRDDTGAPVRGQRDCLGSDSVTQAEKEAGGRQAG